MTSHSIAYRYQPTLLIKDQRFQRTQLNHYHLAIHISPTRLRLSCLDLVSHRCLLIEDYSLDARTPAAYMPAIEQLWQTHPLLGEPVWHTVTLCMENQQYTLIPGSLFQAQATDSYLHLATATNEHIAQYYIHANLGVAVVFGLNASLFNWFQSAYQQSNFYPIHQASSLIAGVATYLATKNESSLPKLFVMVESNHLHIIAMAKAQLLYYNRFAYHEADELLEYILIVMQTLGLPSATQEIIVTGAIGPEDLIYQKLKNYIYKVKLSNPPALLKFGWSFKKPILLQHFDLLSTFYTR